MMVERFRVMRYTGETDAIFHGQFSVKTISEWNLEAVMKIMVKDDRSAKSQNFLMRDKSEDKVGKRKLRAKWQWLMTASNKMALSNLLPVGSVQIGVTIVYFTLYVFFLPMSTLLSLLTFSNIQSNAVLSRLTVTRLYLSQLQISKKKISFPKANIRFFMKSYFYFCSYVFYWFVFLRLINFLKYI